LNNLKQFLERLTFGRAFLIGLAITGVYYMMFYDNGDNLAAAIQSTKAQTQQVETELKAVQAKLDRAKEFQEASQSLGSSLQKMLSYIPAHFRIGQMMKLLSREARLSGLDITQVSEQNVTREDGEMTDFSPLGVNIDLSGQFNQFLTFMSNLTRQRQIFLFDKIDIGSEAGGTTPKEVLKFSASIRAYSYNGTLENGKQNGQNSNQ
jgi:Tfp pilus assembly protein PilO